MTQEIFEEVAKLYEEKEELSKFLNEIEKARKVSLCYYDGISHSYRAIGNKSVDKILNWNIKLILIDVRERIGEIDTQIKYL